MSRIGKIIEIENRQTVVLGLVAGVLGRMGHDC